VCSIQGQVEQVGQAFEVVARGQLGDHPAKLFVQLGLGVDHIRQHSAPVLDDRDGCFVAACFDAES
jgi:hypothetical protein